MAGGDEQHVTKAIRNCRGPGMESNYSFTDGLKKTKYMVIQTVKERERPITEEVEEGKIDRTE